MLYLIALQGNRPPAHTPADTVLAPPNLLSFSGTPKPDPTPWPYQPTIPLTPLPFPELSCLSTQPAVLS